MKKVLAMVGLVMVLAQATQAFQPSGWVYFNWPWAYENSSRDWHWFKTDDVQWVHGYAPADGWRRIGQSGLANGWTYHAWPFVYCQNNNAWYYVNEADTQWVVNMRTGAWSDFGELTVVEFSQGTDTPVSMEIIGSAGGDINVNSGDLAGVRVSFPAGAIPSNSSVTISQNDGTYRPISGTAGPVMDLDLGPVRVFTEAVDITVPYTNQNTHALIPYYINEDGRLEACQVIGVDPHDQTLTFSTFHASAFTWIEELLDALTDSSASGYLPNPNGFQIVNNGSVYNPGGECFGMSAFAQWLYRTGGGSLFPNFMSDIPLAGGGTVKGQNIIATRAHTSVSRLWSSYIPAVNANQNLTVAQRVTSIKNVIKNTGNPTMLYYWGNGAHATLAYGYVGNTIFVNDPNNPGSVMNITYNPAISNVTMYSGWTNLALIGSGSFIKESFANILSDAQSGFSGNGHAQVGPTSHADGEHVTDRTIRFRGNVESGQVLVDHMDIFVNQVNQFSSDIGEDGVFDMALSLNAGTNFLTFKTYGKDLRSNRIEAPNTQLKPFEVVLDSTEAAILVTLTWNTSLTDLDLYVIDPTGDSSWYAHKRTADGGVLDFDDTDGFGPEHWTLTFADTVRWNEDYHVRVHYYADHSTASDEPDTPSTWTVNIIMHEGEPNASSMNFSGTLTVANSGSAGPNGSGAAWNDVAIIRPVRATPDQPAGTLRAMTAADALPVLKIGVPDKNTAEAAKKSAEAMGSDGRWK